MNDITACILTLLIVSPSIAVLFVLIARGVREIWEDCSLSAATLSNQTTECKIPFRGKLCGETS